jgi:hypothetical protein
MTTDYVKEKRKEFLAQQKKWTDWHEKNRAEHPEDYLAGYRPSSKMKEGIESQPTYFHTGVMNQLLKTYDTAKKFGAPNIPPEKLAAMALVEGRHDFGYDDWNKDNKRAATLYQNLINGGANEKAAGFAAAVLDKNEVAHRLKIPFERAWNGTGKTIWGKTGKDYVGNVKDAEKVLSHPKNQPIYNFIKGRTTAEADDENAPVLAQNDAVQMPQEYTEGNWRLI